MSDANQQIEALRQENESLRQQIDVLETNPALPKKRRLRNAFAGIFAFISALLLITAVVGNWTTNTALDTDKFVNRVGPIIDDPAVQAAVADQLTTQITNALNLQTRLQTALPENIRFLSGPISSGANSFIGKEVDKFVASDGFRTLWYAALRIAQESVAEALTGSHDNLVVVDGVVSVDLIEVVDQVLQTISTQLPTVFGKSIQLSIPPDADLTKVRSLVEQYLGVQLPDSFARVPIMDASQLNSIQTGVQVVSTTNILLFVGAFLFFILALLISAARRRTLIFWSIFVALITALVFFGVRTVQNATIGSISDDTQQTAAAAAIRVIFSSLREIGTWILIVSLLIALVAWLVGPGRAARGVRGGVATGSKKTAEWTHNVLTNDDSRDWVRKHLDLLRIGGVVLAVIVLLFWASWLAFAIIAVLLVLFELTVTLMAQREAASSTPPE